MTEPLNIVFMGSDPVALPLLDWLEGEGRSVARLVGILTGPDKASGRGQSVRPNSIKAWSAGRGFPVLQPERLDGPVLSALSALHPDVSLVAAYGHILRDAFIGAPRLGTLNLHASLLPSYRGASPIQSAVASGETVTGMALMRIVRELDAGPVADVERVPIAPLDTAGDVEAKLAAAALPLLGRSLPVLARGELKFVEQPRGATYCRRLEKADGALDFSAPAPTLAARVNGLYPWPSVTVEISGTPVRLGLAEAIDGTGPAGKVLGADAQGLVVGTGGGLLRLRRMQRPGGKLLEAPEFLRGFPIPKGTVLPSRAMPELVAPLPFRR
ncbi:MAG TPA: methionyl-tRNA formyltransferase [Opitutaceae bacterium]|jgi:methionyl-tRNA formyltransferase